MCQDLYVAPAEMKHSSDDYSQLAGCMLCDSMATQILGDRERVRIVERTQERDTMFSITSPVADVFTHDAHRTPDDV